MQVGPVALSTGPTCTNGTSSARRSGGPTANPAFPLRVRLLGSKFVLLKLIALLFADQVQLGGLFWSPG